MAYEVVVIVLIRRLRSARKKHTADPTTHERWKEAHDPCDSLVPVGVTNRD